MRLNHPVTQVERVLHDGALIVSTTDLKGRITSINTEFIDISGFCEDELLGKAHNIVRHPDMPEAAFADLWQTLQKGRPWTGLVKNRCKNGDHYWVVANATPVREAGVVTGYMSVRTKASPSQIREAEALYSELRADTAGRLRLREGRAARQTSAWGMGRLPAWLSRVWTRNRITPAMVRDTIAFIEQLAEGRYGAVLEVSGEGALPDLQRALLTLRIKAGYDRAEGRRQNALSRQSLDAASASIMLADENLRIIYTNASARKLFQEAESDFRKDLPQFQASAILGSNIDIFHRHPAHQRQMLRELRAPHTADIKLGGRAMRIVASPVLDTDGRRLGTAVEWFDRTQEVRAEEEVNDIVRNAVQGDLGHRVDIQRKSGFYLTLARGLNHLLDNMTSIIRTVQAATGEVGRAATEISQGNADLSKRTEEQSSALEQTASSMEQMTATVKQNSDNSTQASQLAETAREQARRGGTVVSGAVESMSAIEQASGRIADIIGTIDEIAFQTNLLALNAAVEAAHAGEQGRGFAVVAVEVRGLAGRTAVAAREIKALIQDSVTKVQEGSRLVAQSGVALEEINAAVKKVADIVSEIAVASREQATGIDQVNRAVMQMDDMTQQNAALVEQAASASEALAQQAAGLVETMQGYRLGNQRTAAARPQAQAQEPDEGPLLQDYLVGHRATG